MKLFLWASMRDRINKDGCQPGQMKDAEIKQSYTLLWTGLGLVLKATDNHNKGWLEFVMELYSSYNCLVWWVCMCVYDNYLFNCLVHSIGRVQAFLPTFFFFIFMKSGLKRASHLSLKNIYLGASLVAQWLRVCLPMQGTRVRALVWEDPACRGAAGPVSHNNWACASGACAPQQERPR